MPQPIDGQSVILWSIEYLRASQRMLTTQLFTTTTSMVIPDYQNDFTTFLATQAAAGGIVPLLQGLMSPDVTFVEMRCQPIWPARYQPIIRVFAGGTVGTRAGTSLPPNTAATLSKKTIFATRWGIGSIHLPAGVVADTQVSGLWTNGMMTNLNGLAAQWAVNWNSGNFTYNFKPILWSKAVPARMTPLTQVIPQSTIRTERRRTVGRGI